jgi:uncharacterized protein (UPF0264 family)
LFGLAGSLREQHLPISRELGADVVGIRTAACRDYQRAGPLERSLVRRLRESVDAASRRVQSMV